MTSLPNKIKSSVESMRSAIQSDGGDISFVSFDNKSGIVEVALHGACIGCPAVSITLREGVLKRLQLKHKEVKDISLAPQSFKLSDASEKTN